MFSKKSLLLVLLFTGIVLSSLGFSYRFFVSPKLFSAGDSYPKLWKRVDSCEKKGLTESALKIVAEIYQRAKNENNAPQFVKALIHKMKYAEYKEEFSQEKNINNLMLEVKNSKIPVKPILQSMLAEAFWQYYQTNRWKFYSRSRTVAFKNNDIATYDLKALINACSTNYSKSLSNKEALKSIQVNMFEEIIVKGSQNTRALRPTLFDFLAHRALDFFKNSEADVTKAANQFNLNDEAFLKTYDEFLKYEVAMPPDSLDFKYNSIKLFQDLLSLHAKDNNENALIDLELERLDFIYTNTKNQLKDSIYISSLKTLGSRFSSNKRTAEIKFKEAEWWLLKASEYKPLAGDEYKWNRKRALEICTGIIKDYPATRGEQLAYNTAEGIRAKSLSINAESINDFNVPNRVLVNYTNINKIYFRVIEINRDDFQQLTSKYYGQELYSKLMKLPTLQSFEQELPDDNDYNAHSIEVKIPALGFGHFVILASASSNFSTQENVLNHFSYVISDMSYLNKRNTQGEYEFYVLNRQSGKPMQGIKAQQVFKTYDHRKQSYTREYGKTYTSDRNGYLKVEKTETPSNSFYMEFTNEKDILQSQESFYSYKDYENNERITKSFLFTDRAIYRPGQTVYFKSIILKGAGKDFEILPNQKITVTFYDVNSQKISSQDLTTNEYGTIAGSFVAPQGVLTGQMHITDGFGTVFISVEEYKRPKFETLIDTLKGQYKLNQEVTIKGLAKAYAGYMIDGADVKFRVVRNINYPYWYYWYKPYYIESSSAEISQGITKTNEKGEYFIKFKALSDPTVDINEKPIYNFEVYADVTDINGETHNTKTSFRLGYQSLELSFETPETINTKSLPQMSLSAKNLNGVEEFVSGTLTVYELKQPDKVFRKRLWEQPDKHAYSKEEFYKFFPNDLYADENNQYTWEKTKTAFKRNFNTKTDKGVLISEFGGLSPGVYLIEGLCKDVAGQEIKSINYVTVYNPLSSEMPVKAPQWAYSMKATAEPGEKASFILASSYKDVHCIYDLEAEKVSKTSTITPSLKPIEITIEENNRGGMIANTWFVKFGRVYSYAQQIVVPFTNKELNIEYSTFRNKLLPGQQEEWKITIKNKKGEKVAAEMLATLYDASLDAFRISALDFNIYGSYYSKNQWAHSLEQLSNSSVFNVYRINSVSVDALSYDYLNYFGLNFNFYSGYRYENKGVVLRSEAFSLSEKNAVQMAPASTLDADTKSGGIAPKEEFAAASKKTTDKTPEGKQDVKARKNFKETAFFFPQLQTNEKGEVILKFTIPESLTRWKFMSFAHTKNLSYGLSKNECVTQKDLILTPNAPRFFRESDKMTFVTKISNLSDRDLAGEAELKFYDAITEKEITEKLLPSLTSQNFSLKRGLSATVEWSIEIPEALEAVKYKVLARAGNYSDGEEMVIPVLTNRMLVTESMPLNVRSNETKDFSFTKFLNQNNNSTTLRNHAYTLEFTSNPAWYAIQSLPYLMEYPYECAEQTFARYYSNALATYLVNSKPKIKEVFDAWKNQSPESFLSNLEKNQELKALILEETPWVLESKNESENKKRLALLFDVNKMNNELSAALIKLEKMQTENGGWPWFAGCPEDWYISQHIISGLGHLQKLGVISAEKDQRVFNIIKKGVAFCDKKLDQEYENLKRQNKLSLKENHLSSLSIQYLYMRSYFKDIDVAFKNKNSVSYFKKQCQTYWLKSSRYLQAMVALGLNRYGEKKIATEILKSLKQNSLTNEEMGMYWKENYGGYYWYQAPIEMQALMIEAFDEVLNDGKSVDALKTWLIKSKHTQNWGTTRATTEAVYALLIRGTDWLSTEPNVEISLGQLKLDPKNDHEIKTEAGTGYFKKTFSGSEIQTEMAKVKIAKKGEGVSWGSVYWQYFEQLDKITPHETPLKLSKKLFTETYTADGPAITPISESNKVKVGDKVKVRIELRADRDLEYVHLKDMRAAGFEPTNVMSGYRYQDGLGYYESTRDASTDFFISYLPKGTYVFEYTVFVNQSGNFSSGISSIQCMYAPEFTSHSEGIRVMVGR